ncbi:hypothetical protein HYC85_001794 [Camellia sinensis]|uniref:Uncharacterized protein n=1 Tax=Camellia sinensis TaxID=4442 RepID=A0A7J7I6Z8_CAMSI|nr:hypothetical protein HYC85_001794 [Camellia sinensis]
MMCHLKFLFEFADSSGEESEHHHLLSRTEVNRVSSYVNNNRYAFIVPHPQMGICSKTVGKKLISLIALALNLDEDFYEKVGAFNPPMPFLRLLQNQQERLFKNEMHIVVKHKLLGEPVGETLYFSSSSLLLVEYRQCRSIFPAIVAGQALRIKRRHTEEQRIKGARARKRLLMIYLSSERVCTSKRMLKKVGSFSKDPIPDTCVTVCGVSELDACSDACARTVYVNQHQVPNWNDICLRRCQSECLKLSASCAS